MPLSPANGLPAIGYRKDIDGLRALAVLAVLLFHLGLAAFEGGYAGVDIFFVISGFLITSIIEKRHAAGAFGLKDFYLGRVRRLIPSILATVAATFLAAVFILTPDDLVLFARSAIGAMASFSNVIFYFEAGYWDSAAHSKPLLHTWSLGIEEQFYLLWPLLLILVFTRTARRAGGVFLGLTIAGLALSEWMVQADPAAAFYLLPFRVFEFSLGALMSRVERSPSWTRLASLWPLRELTFLAGLALCAWAIATFDGSTPFPGLAALVPCTGAALLILAGSGGSGLLGRALFENPASVWLGQVSYSLYLVHWPVIVLYRYQTGADLGAAEQIGLTGAILVATLALHYGVERRFRFRARQKRGRGPLSPSAFALVALLCGYSMTLVSGHAVVSQGWSWRFPSLAYSPQQIEEGMSRRFLHLQTGCQVADFFTSPACRTERPIQALVLGNSHEPDGYNFFRAAFGDRTDFNLIFFGTVNECDDMQPAADGGWISRTPACAQRMAALFEPGFVGQLDILIYSSNRPFAEGTAATAPGNVLSMIASLKARNPDIRVVTLGGYLNTSADCARLINQTGDPDICRSPEHVVEFEDEPDRAPLFQEAMAVTDVFIDRIGLLCAERRLERCLVQTPEGVPAMYDRHHLSLEFAEMAGRLFAASDPGFLDRLVPADAAAGDALLSEADIAAGRSRRYQNILSGCRIDQMPASPACHPGRDLQVLVLGNSAETDAFNFLKAAAGEREDLNLIYFGSAGDCADLALRAGRWQSSAPGCQKRLDALMDPGFLDRLDAIVYGSDRPYAGGEDAAAPQNLLRLFSFLKARRPGLRLVVFSGYLTTRLDCPALVNQEGDLSACRRPGNVSYFEDDPSREPHFETARAMTDVLIDRVALLCPERRLENCRVATGAGIPVMYDTNNQSLEFAEMSGRLFAEQNPGFFDRLKLPLQPR